MEFTLFGHKKPISTEKLVKEVKNIMVQIVDKLIPKLLIRFTIDGKLKQRKFGWFYKLIQRKVVLERLAERLS